MADLVEGYIARLFEREGGFSDLKADRGGATKFGVTRSTLGYYLGREATIEDVRTLTIEVATAIYRKLYFDNHRIGLLPDEIEEQVFDFGVNSGPGVAIGALQECLSLTNDGKIGPKTVAAAIVACKPDGGRVLNLKLAKWRVMMLARIVRRDPSQVIFLGGWLKRALEFAR